MKLSIIIPAYNAEKYLPKLLETLDKQMQEGIEVIIIDDGSKVPVKVEYEWAKVIRQENAGPGMARNAGLDKITGEYFTFIDADDLVTKDYIAKVMEKIEEGFDYCYLSWKTLPGGWDCKVQLNSIEDTFPPFNLCVWNRIYKTETFGAHRFSKTKLWAEDADYIYRLNERGKKAFIHDIIYLYRSDTPNSWTKRMFSGDLDSTRIVYNVKEVNKSIRDEIVKEFEHNEVVLLTNKNPFPELQKKAMILPYGTPIKGTILRGDEYLGFTRIKKAKTTQVVIWTAVTGRIGGIETFIYAFCENMRKYYDIIVMYDQIDTEQLARLSKIVECVKRTDEKIKCDTLIVNRITDENPHNVIFKQKIQMCHICEMGRYKVPSDNDATIYVSEACKRSYGADNGVVIHNMLPPLDNREPIKLVSAMRQTYEKGEKRMVEMAKAMDREGIPYIWLYFTEQPIKDATPSMIHATPRLDIAPIIKGSDYLVQLSDAEAFGYTIAEALALGTAVISTPIEVLDELGFVGYTVPFDMKDVQPKRFLNIPEVKVKNETRTIIKKWREVLGDKKPKHDYKPDYLVTVKATQHYFDIGLQRTVNKGEINLMSFERAIAVEGKGLGVRV